MNSKIAYFAIPNPTGTAAEAPALPRVIPNGVANTNDVIADIRNGIAATEARCRIALEAILAVAIEHVRNGETVDLGGFRLRARIPGSMPCVDTPFDFGANTLVVDVLADQELNAALEGLVPYKVDASELTSMIKVSNVTDVATMRIGEIRGTDEFIITGNGVTLDAPGESAKLVDKKTQAELATAEVVSVSKGQRATCKFAAVTGGVAAGQYWLVVTTFGLIGETTPRAFRKPVTLVEAIPAPPEPIAKSEDGITKVMTLVDAVTGADRVISGMNDFVLDGEGLELAEDGGDGVTGVRFSGPGLEDYLDLTQGARNDGSKLITGVGSYVDTLEPGDHECHLGLYLKHGEATDLNVWIDFTLRKE